MKIQFVITLAGLVTLVTSVEPVQPQTYETVSMGNIFSMKKGAESGGDTCFCKLHGQIDDCMCNVDTVDYFNNMKIFPRLQSLLHKPYFR